MNWRMIRTIYGKEMRDSLRDYRTIISMIAVPVLVIPLLMLGVGSFAVKSMAKAQGEVPRIMIIGGENSSNVLSALRASGAFRIVPAAADFTNQVAQKKIRAAVRLPSDFDAMVQRGEIPEVNIYQFQTDVGSDLAATKLSTSSET